MEAELSKINSRVGTVVKDCDTEEFIKVFSAFLKKSGKFKIPEWAEYVKTAHFKELAPYDPDWLYIRGAAIARQIYMRKKISSKSLRHHYGGRARFGTSRNHHRLAAGGIIRYCLKQLKAMGLVEQVQYDDGQTNWVVGKKVNDMDRIAFQICKQDN